MAVTRPETSCACFVGFAPCWTPTTTIKHTTTQIRKLLRTNGLLGGAAGGRRLGKAAAGDEWASDLEGGDPLLEAERAAVEDLYVRHLAADDYLEQVGDTAGDAVGDMVVPWHSDLQCIDKQSSDQDKMAMHFLMRSLSLSQSLSFAP